MTQNPLIDLDFDSPEVRLRLDELDVVNQMKLDPRRDVATRIALSKILDRWIELGAPSTLDDAYHVAAISTVTARSKEGRLLLSRMDLDGIRREVESKLHKPQMSMNEMMDVVRLAVVWITVFGADADMEIAAIRFYDPERNSLRLDRVLASEPDRDRLVQMALRSAFNDMMVGLTTLLDNWKAQRPLDPPQEHVLIPDVDEFLLIPIPEGSREAFRSFCQTYALFTSRIAWMLRIAFRHQAGETETGEDTW